MNRRGALNGLCSLGISSGFAKRVSAQPRLGLDAEGYRIPGEFEPTRAVWVGYDDGHRDLTTSLVRVLAPHTKIKFMVSDQGQASAAKTLMQERGIAATQIEIFLSPHTKFFLRDVTSMAISQTGQMRNLSFKWSNYGLAGWCQRRYHGAYDKILGCTGNSDKTRNEASREIALLTHTDLIESRLFIEGGAVEVNGLGLLIANEGLLKQRNPGSDRASLERALLALPGVRKVVWLPQGLAEDPQGRATIFGNYIAWGTGGHTDQFVRFVDANTVMLAWPDDAQVLRHPVSRMTRKRMQRNFDILSRVNAPQGGYLRVIKVPMPLTIERKVVLSAEADRDWSHEWTPDFFPERERRREGEVLTQIASASYLNFVIANDVVVIPDYIGHGTASAVQDRVRRIFESAFKGRSLAFVDSISANWVGGGPHCATLKEPYS
jgi:agmatine deiminase